MKKYWNDNGLFQKEYDEMLNANFNFSKKSLSTFYKYRRYYNDGDLPKGSAFIGSLANIECYLEQMANIAVAKEYTKFAKKFNRELSSTLIFYAKKNVTGYKAWIEKSIS